jgi:hypothetical protein
VREKDVLAKLKKTHVATKETFWSWCGSNRWRIETPENTKLQWFTGGDGPSGSKERK